MRRRTAVVLSVAVAVVVLLSTLALTFEAKVYPFEPVTRAPAGPAFTATAVSLTGSAPTDLSGAWVSVFSILPSTLSSGANGINASQYVLLYEGQTNGHGRASGYLGASFAPIVQDWVAITTPLTATVSLLVEGEYLAPGENHSSLYSAYDYVPYDPRLPPASFAVQVGFNLADPIGTAAPVVGAQGPAVFPSTSGTSCPATDRDSNTWVTDYDNTTTEPFPLFAADNLQRTNPASLLAFSDSWIGPDLEVGFTGVQGSTSGTEPSVRLSEQASWEGNNSTGAAGIVTIPGVAVGAAARALGAVFLVGVSLNILRQTDTIIAYSPPDCVEQESVTQYATLSAVNVLSTTLELTSDIFSENYSSLLSELGELGSESPVANLSLPYGSNVNATPYVNDASGWSDAAAEEQEVVHAQSVFTSEWGFGLAFMDVLALCGTTCDAGGIAGAWSVLTSALGSELDLAGALDSVGFSVSAPSWPNLILIDADYGSFYVNFSEAAGIAGLGTVTGVSPPIGMVDVTY